MNMQDSRLEKVEAVTIPFEEFQKALKRNYLDERTAMNNRQSHVLRLYPPFNPEMEVEYYVSKQGRHYNSDWNEKPFHITPELIVYDELGKVCEWPTRANTREFVPEGDEESLERAVEEGRNIFWSDLERILPETFDLNAGHPGPSYTVDLEWV